MGYLNSNINISVHSRKVPVRAAKTRNKHCLLIIIPFVFLSAHGARRRSTDCGESLCVHVCGRGAERKRCGTYFSGLFLKSFFGRKIITELRSFVSFQ